MWRKGNLWTTHHIVPRYEWGTNDEDNLLRMKLWPHQALHILHVTRLIGEQLIHTVELSEKAMRPEVVKQLLEVFNEHDPRDLNYRYKDNVHI